LLKVVEIDVVEIKKALLRAGHDLFIPAHYKLIDCYDGMQWNIPEIALTDESKVSDQLPLLLSALAGVLAAKNNPSQTVAFTCSWPRMDQQKVVLSILGSSEILIKWLQKFPTVPLEHAKFITWLKAQETWLSAFSAKFDIPRLTDVLCDDGTLFIKREPVFKYAVPGSVKIEGTKFNMEIKPGFEELNDLILAKSIGYAPTCLVEKILCKKCGQDYTSCPHSDPLDKTGTDIKEFQIIGYYWVDARS